MKEHGILFSGAMVRAILAGAKTQTRRVLKPQPEWRDRNGMSAAGWAWDAGEPSRASFRSWQDPGPFGEAIAAYVRFAAGDRLWVRETAVIAPPNWTNTPTNPMGPHRQEVAYLADSPSGKVSDAARDYGLKATPSIFMPRWASRITLDVTAVRIERLQDISEADAIAEGVVKVREHCYVIRGVDYDLSGLCHSSPITPYAKLWDTLNGGKAGKAWDDNPWVVVTEFVRVQPQERAA